MTTSPVAIRANAIGYDEFWVTLDFGHYPAGEPYVKDTPLGIEYGFELLVRTADIGVLNEALMFVDAMKWRHGDIPVDLHLPHFPGARQDRLNPDGDLLFTAKSVANMINQRGFRSVWVVDPHSDVVTALVENVQVVTALDCLAYGAKVMLDQSRWAGVIAPDGGAEKRALKVATYLEVPLYQAWKNRDISTGQISGFGCQDIPPSDKPYLVVDDLCDGGGTFMGLAGVIPTGVTLDLYVTHGLFTKGIEGLAMAFDEIYTTDSIGLVPADVTCIEIAHLLKETQQ